jgi:hydrogenase maturation protease
MSDPRILIAGIGNVFLGDDAFGVEVAQRLTLEPWPEGVRVTDFGIRGFDLAYAIMDGYDATILIDATPRGGDPGTVYTVEIDCSETREPSGMDAHSMNPERVLELVRMLGGEPRHVFLVGCEPATLGDPDEGAMELSPAVEAAVDAAVGAVKRLAAKLTQEFRAAVPV